MINIFKCKHKFKHLAVYSDSTEKDNRRHKAFPSKIITHNLWCTNCETKLELEYVKVKP